jgi:hypothetical protein
MLSDRDRAVIDFERAWFLYPGPKDRAVAEYLGMSATRYYQVLRRLLDDPDAERYDPLTIRRLRRVRAQAQAKRLEKRLDGGTPGT